MLKIQFKDRRKSAMWLVDSSITLGSDAKCDIVVDEASVDAVHCQLVIEQADITLINKSENRSVFVNDVPIAKSKKLQAWDVIRLGKSELEIIDPLKERKSAAAKPEANQTIIRTALSPWMIKANSKPLVGQFFQVSNGFSLGRDESADVTIPFTYISRTHVRLLIKGDKLFAEDAKSSNGTFVNNEKISYQELQNGDELRLDEFIFSVIGPEKAQENKAAKPSKKKNVKHKAKKAVKVDNADALAIKKMYLHDIGPHSGGMVYEIVKANNHLSKMLGHHLSTSEKSVSARHVHLNETDLGWEIENNGASDGLIVNSKMQIRAILKDEDEITVGGTHLKCQLSGEVARSYYKPTGPNNSLMIAGISVALIGAISVVAFLQGWI